MRFTKSNLQDDTIEVFQVGIHNNPSNGLWWATIHTRKRLSRELDLYSIPAELDLFNVLNNLKKELSAYISD